MAFIEAIFLQGVIPVFPFGKENEKGYNKNQMLKCWFVADYWQSIALSNTWLFILVRCCRSCPTGRIEVVTNFFKKRLVSTIDVFLGILEQWSNYLPRSIFRCFYKTPSPPLSCSICFSLWRKCLFFHALLCKVYFNFWIIFYSSYFRRVFRTQSKI